MQTAAIARPCQASPRAAPALRRRPLAARRAARLVPCANPGDESISDKVKDALHSAAQAASDVAHTVKEAVTGAAADVKEAVGGAEKEAREGAGYAKQKAEDTLGDVEGSAKGAVEAAKGRAAEAVDSAKGGAAHVAGEAQRKAEGGLQHLPPHLLSHVHLPERPYQTHAKSWGYVVKNVGDAASRHARDVSEAAKEKYDELQGDAREAKGRAEAKGEDVAKDVGDRVKGAADELKP